MAAKDIYYDICDWLNKKVFTKTTKRINHHSTKLFNLNDENVWSFVFITKRWLKVKLKQWQAPGAILI